MQIARSGRLLLVAFNLGLLAAWFGLFVVIFLRADRVPDPTDDGKAVATMFAVLIATVAASIVSNVYALVRGGVWFARVTLFSLGLILLLVLWPALGGLLFIAVAVLIVSFLTAAFSSPSMGRR